VASPEVLGLKEYWHQFRPDAVRATASALVVLRMYSREHDLRIVEVGTGLLTKSARYFLPTRRCSRSHRTIIKHPNIDHHHTSPVPTDNIYLMRTRDPLSTSPPVKV
jgi:hypothetical protein